MITRYLNQEAVLHVVTGRNEYGEPVTEPHTLKCRWEGKRRLVRNAEGQEEVSEATMFCKEPVQVGDLLEYEGRTWTAISVYTVPDLAGNISHREVAL